MIQRVNAARTPKADRLRVLFLTSWYPTPTRPVGGIFVREHAKAVQLYNDVVVAHLAGPRTDIDGWWQLEEERDHALTEGLRTYRVWYRPLSVPKTSTAMRGWASFWGVRELIRHRFRPDIIHANVYDSAAVGALLSRIHHIPMVATEHFSGFPRHLLTRLQVMTARLGFRAADVVMPVSRDLQESLASYGVKTRFKVIPNVVDVNLFRVARRKFSNGGMKRLLFVGLLDASHVKGLPVLLEALSNLQNRRTDWHLDIVGDGPARSRYERLSEESGVQERVRFHGLKPKSEVATFMSNADLFILPSIWENLPCVLIEAMASGLPILSSTVGGIPEIVDSEIGRLAPPGDPEALATALDEMLDSLHGYDREAIARRARRFSPEVVGAAIDRVYREVLGLPVSGPGDTMPIDSTSHLTPTDTGGARL